MMEEEKEERVYAELCFIKTLQKIFNTKVVYDTSDHKLHLNISNKYIWDGLTCEYGFNTYFNIDIVSSKLIDRSDIIRAVSYYGLDSFIYRKNGEDFLINKDGFEDFKEGKINIKVCIN